MNIIIKKRSSIKAFYERTIREKLPNKESLFKTVTKEFRQLLRNSPRLSHRRALDLGYGYGNYSIALARKGYHVLAIDFISPQYFRNRIAEMALSIKALKKDLHDFVPNDMYDMIVAKDVFHFLHKPHLKRLLKQLIQATNDGGQHYLVLFTDIKRTSKDVKIVVEDEAHLTSAELLLWVTQLYKGWEVALSIEEYKERDRHIKGAFYFVANRVTIIAKRV